MKLPSKSPAAAPLSFEIDETLAGRLKEVNDQLGNYPLSQVVALALEKFDFARHKVSSVERRQLSVRLPQAQRARLEAEAKANGVSMAFLIREALEEFSRHPIKGASLRTVQRELDGRRVRRPAAEPTEGAAAKTEAKARVKKPHRGKKAARRPALKGGLLARKKAKKS